jgi:hypothetical protein
MPLALCLRSMFALLVVCALTSALALAQTGTATLSGAIQDPKGAVVPDVEVIATRIETGTRIATKTNGAGIYVLTGLMPGHYHLLIHRAGFKEIAIKEFELHIQDKLEQNFSLELGSVSETVTVSANHEHMETDDPAVGLLVDRAFVENVPLNGRSLQDLIALAPGTVSSPNNTDGSGAFSVNGQRPDANYYTVDGLSANISPQASPSATGVGLGGAGVLPAQTALGTTQALVPLDALQEFKIETSGYTADSGRQPGGQVSLTTRSGTNDLHGSLFDYLRNEAFDANYWFNNNNGIPRQQERQNDFGGTIGGPLIVPKLYNGKNKTFYFVSYEGLRLRLPAFVQADVPTAALRAFASAALLPFLDSQPLPNGANIGDQCIASLDPTNPAYAFSCSAVFRAGFSNPASLDSFGLRVDQIIGKKIRLFGRFANTPSNSTILANFGPGGSSAVENTMWLWTLGMTANITDHLVNEARFNYTSASGNYNQKPVPFFGGIPYSRDLLLPSQYVPANGSFSGDIALTIGNTFLFPPNYGYNISRTNQYNLVDSISWSSGKHLFKFGVDYRRLNSLATAFQYETLFALQSPQEVQQGFASFALVGASQPARPVFDNVSVFGQDHFAVSQRLSLDVGIRWELNPAPGASDGIYPLALTSANLAVAQIAAAGTPQYHTIYSNFAPRFGFAYKVNSSTDHPVVVRGGFGIFYDTGQALGGSGYAGYPFFVSTAPFSATFPLSVGAVAPPPLNVPLVPPYGYIAGASDPNLKLPYTEQWNLSVDAGLMNNNTLTVSYVGNDGRKLLYSGFYVPSGNPLFGTNGITVTTNSGASNYNALQVQDQGYIGPQLQLIASYTFAHALDNVSNDQNSPFPPVRGNSDYDVRQVFNEALNYKTSAIGSSRFARAFTNGWTFSERFSASSGYPLEVFQGEYILQDGQTQIITPDLVRGVPVYLHNVKGALGSWSLNYAAFSPVPTDPVTGAPLRLGDLGSNALHGPGFWNINTSVQRTFGITEKLKFDFRVDAFNLLNHPNPSAIDTNLADGPNLFGSSGAQAAIGVPNALYATGAPRSLQLSLKLLF